MPRCLPGRGLGAVSRWVAAEAGSHSNNTTSLKRAAIPWQKLLSFLLPCRCIVVLSGTILRGWLRAEWQDFEPEGPSD